MITKKIKNLFTVEEDDEEMDEAIEMTEEEASRYTHYEKGTDNPKLKKASNAVLVLFEPRSLSDAHEIGSHLMKTKAAVVNMHRLDAGTARRVCDFLTGVVFALQGDKVLVGDNVYLFTPNSIGVDGQIDVTNQNEEK